MDESLDVATLLEVIRRYHPPNLDADDPRYQRSREFQRLRARLDELRVELEEKRPDPSWAAFCAHVRETFSGSVVWDTTIPSSEPCRRCKVYMPGVVPGQEGPAESVEIMRSILAPVYMVYASHHSSERGESWIVLPPLPERFRAHGERLVELMAQHMPARAVDTDVLESLVVDRVPWASNAALGQAKLMHFLFGDRLF